MSSPQPTTPYQPLEEKPAAAVPQPQVVNVPSQRRYSHVVHTPGCQKRFFSFLNIYIGAVVLCCFLTSIFPEWGGVMLAVAPSACIVHYYRTRYRSHILPWQDLWIFVECYAFIWGVAEAEGVIMRAFNMRQSPTFINIFVTAFIAAAGCEELFKYFLCRRFLYKPHVVDPRALIYYGIVAANAFAAIENIKYVTSTIEATRKAYGVSIGPVVLAAPDQGLLDLLSLLTGGLFSAAPVEIPPMPDRPVPSIGAAFSDLPSTVQQQVVGQMIATGFMRSILSIPLHSCTGAIIGAMFGKRRFMGQQLPMFKVLAMPIFLHGLYDFAAMGGYPAMLGKSVDTGMLVVASLFGTYLGGLLLAKHYTAELAKAVAPVDLRDALAVQQGCAPSEAKLPYPDSLFHAVACCTHGPAAVWPRGRSLANQPVVVGSYQPPVPVVRNLQPQPQPEQQV